MRGFSQSDRFPSIIMLHIIFLDILCLIFDTVKANIACRPLQEEWVCINISSLLYRCKGRQWAGLTCIYIYTYVKKHTRTHRIGYRFIWHRTRGGHWKILKIRVPWKADNFDQLNDYLLPYKSEGNGFDSRWFTAIIYWHNPSAVLWAWYWISL